MSNDIKEILIGLAEYNDKGYKFSAIIKLPHRWYWAVNQVIAKNDPTAHAEIEAIRYACMQEGVERLENAVIYCSGEPCPMCLTAIMWAGIKEVYYVNTYDNADENNDYYDRPSEEVAANLGFDIKLRRL